MAAEHQPQTFSEFLRAMRTACSPHGVTVPKLERACDIMWHDGILGGGDISRLCDISRPTGYKWVMAARNLGLTKGQARPRSAAERKVNPADLIKNTILDGSAEEIRDRLRASISQRLESADNKEYPALVKLANDLIPGLKVPETRLDVQLILGRGSDDAIEERLADSLKWLSLNDRAFLPKILERAGLRPTDLLPSAQEITDAEVEDAPAPTSQPRRDHPSGSRGQ
jgi:hypothetical protein